MSRLEMQAIRKAICDQRFDRVDGSEFAGFGVDFGSTGTIAFDFNADATVDALDFREFGNRFGVTL